MQTQFSKVCTLDSLVIKIATCWKHKQYAEKYCLRARPCYGLFVAKCNFFLMSGLGLLLRMFCFLCFTLAVRNKLYYTGDEPMFHQLFAVKIVVANHLV